MDHKGDIERNIDARKFNLYVLLSNHFPFGTLTSEQLPLEQPIYCVYEDVYRLKPTKFSMFQQRTHFPYHLGLESRMASKFRKIHRAARPSIMVRILVSVVEKLETKSS